MVGHEIEPAPERYVSTLSALDDEKKYDDDMAKTDKEADIEVTAVRGFEYEKNAGEMTDEEKGEFTSADVAQHAESIARMTAPQCRAIITELYKIHEPDPNFSNDLLITMKTFLSDEYDDLPVARQDAILHEMKIEAVLATENSPYPIVRAVVNTDDNTDTPCLTLRVWLIGTVYVIAGAFINQLFDIRQPAITVTSNVAQLLAYPAGKALERVLPDKGFNYRGEYYSMNPGRFSKREHMLITIMANVGFATPYTVNIIISQYLPQYFNQAYASGFLYQILIGLGTNFVGYGMAGITRRFLVYPSSCVWPASLVTIALNQSFHEGSEGSIPGPFNRLYHWSRLKFFLVAFLAMFIYYWFPGFIAPFLSTFNWLSWIAPNNQVFNNIVGSNNGLGLNPWPTFDWNMASYLLDPLALPFYVTINYVGGAFFAFFVILGIYYSNALDSGYLPINSNHVFDNTGSAYNISKVIDSRGIFDKEGYQSYSPAFMSAGNSTIYFFFFAVYSATVSYTFLFHRHEISIGFSRAWRDFRAKRKGTQVQEDDDALTMDIHQRIQMKHPEVSEWYYLLVLVIAAGIGMAGIGAFETYTNPAVVLFGIALCLIFVIPIGLINAITGVQVTLNVLAEFIGGAWVEGNALSMNYFKSFGYITCAQALSFANDLKMAHYTHIPPWHTFWVQIVGTFISTFVCTGVFNYQLNIPNVCTPEAAFGFSCPGINTFFTAAVFWGTLGPKKVFGPGGQYTTLLVGFPFGLMVPVALYFARKRFPQSGWVRSIHPVVILNGALSFAPYNLSYLIPTILPAILSWQVVRKRYLAFWSRYNYVLAAAWSAAIAICAVILFFALQFNGSVVYENWATDIMYEGCEGSACRRLEVPAQGYFGPAPGEF